MKSAFVTGSSRGIGYEIAKELLKNGYAVAINGRDAVNLRGAAENLYSECGARPLELVGDVSSADFVRSAFGKIEEEFGGLTLLVNNAGIAHIGLFTDITDETWAKIIGINLSGAAYCSREAAKIMLKKHGGSIVNISSMWGQVGASCEVAYSAAKGGLDALTKALAKELAPEHVRVNAVSFGVIDTEMNHCFSEEELDALCEEIPAGRFGSPVEAAEFVRIIAESPEYLTGQIIRMDGGMI